MTFFLSNIHRQSFHRHVPVYCDNCIINSYAQRHDRLHILVYVQAASRSSGVQLFIVESSYFPLLMCVRVNITGVTGGCEDPCMSRFVSRKCPSFLCILCFTICSGWKKFVSRWGRSLYALNLGVHLLDVLLLIWVGRENIIGSLCLCEICAGTWTSYCP